MAHEIDCLVSVCSALTLISVLKEEVREGEGRGKRGERGENKREG